MTPSAMRAMASACSGVLMPKPTAAGTWVACLTAARMGGQIGLDLTAHPRHPHGGHHVEEAPGGPRDGLDPLLGGGRHQGNHVDAVRLRHPRHLVLFLVGQIGDDDAVHPRRLAPGEKRLVAVVKHRIEVG